MSTITTPVTLGPPDDGQTMTLEEFADAQGQAGYRYELSRGVVTVIEVPNEPHCDIVDEIRYLLDGYRRNHPDIIYRVLHGSEGKIPIEEVESERHPDLLIYKQRRPPNTSGRGVWSAWIPELVIEVVSPDSADRDYNQKPEEYLQFGVQEYWIVDDARQQMTVHQRSDDEWVKTTVSPGAVYTTPLLQGFDFDLQAVFDAIGP